MNQDLMFSSKTDEWETPQDFFDELNKEFKFTLDPCAGKSNYKCDKYFTKEQDGLQQTWEDETVFCNPPYGREIGKWVKKCHEESLKDWKCKVMLIPARTDTKWFHEYIYGKAIIRFIRGRLKFNNYQYNAPFPCMIVIFHNPKQCDYYNGEYS